MLQARHTYIARMPSILDSKAIVNRIDKFYFYIRNEKKVLQYFGQRMVK